MMDTTVAVVLVWIIGSIISMTIIYHLNEKLTLGHIIGSIIGWYFVLFASLVVGIAYVFVTIGEKCNNVVLFEKKWKCPKTLSWYDENINNKDKKFNKSNKK